MSLQLNIEKIYQGRLWVIHGYTIQRETVDLWEATVRNYIETFGGNPERYLVYDMTGVDKLRYFPYLGERMAALVKDNRTATGRVGIAVNFTPTFHYLLESFLQYTRHGLQPYLQVKIFQTRQQAIEWVAEILPDEYKSGDHTPS